MDQNISINNMGAVYQKLISTVHKLQLLDIQLSNVLSTGTKVQSPETIKNFPLLDYNRQLDVIYGGVAKRYNCGK